MPRFGPSNAQIGANVDSTGQVCHHVCLSGALRHCRDRWIHHAATTLLCASDNRLKRHFGCSSSFLISLQIDIVLLSPID